MDESHYLKLVGETFRKIEDAVENIDPSDIDFDSAGDVMSLTMKNGVKCIVNTQRPVRQIWVAARANAWHFSWNDGTKTWQDDKGRGELFATLKAIAKEHAGIELAF
jgi:CyaY protein